MNPAQLLSHMHTTHLLSASGPIACGWATCRVSPCTTSHMLTHIPLPRQHPVPEMILSNPKQDGWLSAPNITSRSFPRLPSTYKLHFTASSTPTEPENRQPRGAAFLSALLLRNLAKTLRNELASAQSLGEGEGDIHMGDLSTSGHSRSARKQHLEAERFGLPIPETVLKEEEEEERNAAKADDVEGSLNWEERDRARAAFAGMEEKLGEVVAGNLSGLGQYLGEAWGW